MKKVLKGGVLALALALNAFGISSLLHVAKIAPSGLTFYDKLPLLGAYTIIIVCMSAGIMLLTVFAGMLGDKAKKILSITVCTYSTVLTLPLLYTFVGCFFVANGISLPMVGDIVVEFKRYFASAGMQYLIFSAGVLMSIVFLAVPIISTIITVKGKSPKELKTIDEQFAEEIAEVDNNTLPSDDLK